MKNFRVNPRSVGIGALTWTWTRAYIDQSEVRISIHMNVQRPVFLTVTYHHCSTRNMLNPSQSNQFQTAHDNLFPTRYYLVLCGLDFWGIDDVAIADSDLCKKLMVLRQICDTPLTEITYFKLKPKSQFPSLQQVLIIVTCTQDRRFKDLSSNLKCKPQVPLSVKEVSKVV